MCSDKARPTVDELFEMLKRTSIPTVLVEGKDDVIFYRAVEEELCEYGVDMLPAGNKDAVLELRKRIKESSISLPMIYIVDNDLWVYSPPEDSEDVCELIRTFGYSVENDLFADGSLESLLSVEERARFKTDLDKFLRWYVLSVNRKLSGFDSAFRTHPGKVLDDEDFYLSETQLAPGEIYPDDLFNIISNNYIRLLRGKSLFALLLRQLSSKGRDVKFGAKQLMAFGASRKGPHFQRVYSAVRGVLEGTVAME